MKNKRKDLQSDKSYCSKLQVVKKICKKFVCPKVFHSKLYILKIRYIWIENHSSGFTVQFDFHHYYYPTDVDWAQTGVALGSAYLMHRPFIIICVASPCTLRSRMWHPCRHGREQLETNQLQEDSQLSTAAHLPTSSVTTSQDKYLEQQITELHEHYVQVKSIQTDISLNLPPQIPVSKDGEEGYIESQKHLICKHSRYIDQIIRPPPNKTVHDRESPPPYYSSSASIENLGPSPIRMVRDADDCPRVFCCYSMSSNVSSKSSKGHLKDIQRHSVARAHNWPETSRSFAGTVNVSLSSNGLSDGSPKYQCLYSCDNNKLCPSLDYY